MQGVIILDTAYYDNVLKEKEKYNNPAIELVAVEDSQIVGKPVEDIEVRDIIQNYMKTMLEFIGEEAISAFSGLENTEAHELEKMVPSPFSKEEEEWLNKAMEYYAIQNGMDDPQENQG